MMEIDWRDKGLVMELIFSQRLTTLCHDLRTSDRTANRNCHDGFNDGDEAACLIESPTSLLNQKHSNSIIIR